MNFWDSVKYFKPSEFDSPDEPGSGIQIDHFLVKMLDELRQRYGGPIIITSGVRTKKRNEYLAKRGYQVAKDSAHLSGHAADIQVTNNAQRFELLSEIFEVGFLRVGDGDDFIHVDVDLSKSQRTFWSYPPKTKGGRVI